jgi:hypothetical protein
MHEQLSWSVLNLKAAAAELRRHSRLGAIRLVKGFQAASCYRSRHLQTKLILESPAPMTGTTKFRRGLGGEESRRSKNVDAFGVALLRNNEGLANPLRRFQSTLICRRQHWRHSYPILSPPGLSF